MEVHFGRWELLGGVLLIAGSEHAQLEIPHIHMAAQGYDQGEVQSLPTANDAESRNKPPDSSLLRRKPGREPSEHKERSLRTLTLFHSP